VEVRYRTREGLKLQVGAGQEASCPGLPVPARIVGKSRPPRRSTILLHKKGDGFWIELVEGSDGLRLEDELATLVHLHFHVHQYRYEVDYDEVNPRGNAPGPAWAFLNVPSTEQTARRMAVMAQDVVAEGFSAEGGMALLLLRRRHAEELRSAHPRLPAAVALQERFEGSAAYVENQLVAIEAARLLLIGAGVDEERLDPVAWRAEALGVGPDYPSATGFAVALVLDAAGGPWKEDLDQMGFDAVLERAAMAAVDGGGPFAGDP
jgi:hypothetical protein